MKFKFNKMALGVSLGVSALVLSASAFAVPAGDNAVHFPKNGGTVTTDSTDIWFASVPDIDGYLIHLERRAATGCGGPALGETRVYVDAGEISCANDSVATAGVVGDYSANAIKLCKWTTPAGTLTDGHYALGVTGLNFGADIAINTVNVTGFCSDDTELTSTASNITGFGGDGISVAAGIAGKHYNEFEVNTDAGATITQAPSKMVVTSPGWNVAGNNTMFTGSTAEDIIFKDYSPAEGKANWYEVYIYNVTQSKRVEFDSDNANAKYWYKVGVDTGPKGVDVDAAAVTDGGGTYHEVTIDNIVAKTPADVASNDILRIWVRGYNDEKYAGAWSDEVRIKE